MCYRDKNEVEVFINDTVEYNDVMYCIRGIASYPCATVVILENLKTLVVETVFLRDVIKI